MMPILYIIAFCTGIYCATTNNWAAFATFCIGILCQAIGVVWKVREYENKNRI